VSHSATARLLDLLLSQHCELNPALSLEHSLPLSDKEKQNGCGGELEQIQFLLGHASVQTTERYIRRKQKLQDAVNDRLGI
jgi:integrase